MIDVVMIVESTIARLLDIMVGMMRHGILGMSVLRCHPLVGETTVRIQEPVLQPVRVVVATKPLQRPGLRGRCSSLHLDHGHKTPTMAG